MPRQRPELDLTATFAELMARLPPPHQMLTSASLELLPLPAGIEWTELGFLLVPGLLTKWYPLYALRVLPPKDALWCPQHHADADPLARARFGFRYMKHLLADMKRLGLRVQFSRINTDQPVRINAARLRHEILEIAQEGRQVVLLGHSKGAVDAAAALSLFPELHEFVAGVVSLQAPHGGSAIAHDLSNTNLQKTVPSPLPYLSSTQGRSPYSAGDQAQARSRNRDSSLAPTPNLSPGRPRRSREVAARLQACGARSCL